MAGDWHGNLPWALEVLRRAAEQGATCVIQLGDFGYWGGRHGDRYGTWTASRGELARLEMQLYFVDGNHEDFNRLLAEPISPATGVRPIRDRMTPCSNGATVTGSPFTAWTRTNPHPTATRSWCAQGHEASPAKGGDPRGRCY